MVEKGRRAGTQARSEIGPHRRGGALPNIERHRVKHGRVIDHAIGEGDRLLLSRGGRRGRNAFSVDPIGIDRHPRLSPRSS